MNIKRSIYTQKVEKIIFTVVNHCKQCVVVCYGYVLRLNKNLLDSMNQKEIVWENTTPLV
jgi:NAD-dependent dihydropyrimidine dehydrogenase PreA subunit